MSDVKLNWRTTGRLEVGRVCRAAAVVVVQPESVSAYSPATVNVYVHGRRTASISTIYRDLDFWVQLAANVCVSQTDVAAVAQAVRRAPRTRNRKERRIVLAKTMLRAIQGGIK